MLKIFIVLLWGVLSGLVYGQSAAENTKSDSKRKRRVKITFGWVSSTRQKSPYSYRAIFYPALFIPGGNIGPYRVYYEPLIKGRKNLPFSITYLKRLKPRDQYLKARLKSSEKSVKFQPDRSLPNLTAKQIDQTIQKALAFFKRNKFRESMTLLKKVLIAEPEEAVTAILYGHSLFALGYYQFAASALRKGMRLLDSPAGPPTGEADEAGKFEDTPMNLAEFYKKPKTLEKQISELETWVKYNPEDREAKFLLGYVYFFTGRYAASQTVLKSLLEPQNPDTKESVSEQKDKEAERLLKKAKQLLEKPKPRSK